MSVGVEEDQCVLGLADPLTTAGERSKPEVSDVQMRHLRVSSNSFAFSIAIWTVESCWERLLDYANLLHGTETSTTAARAIS